jgi:hypothetical protein
MNLLRSLAVGGVVVSFDASAAWAGSALFAAGTDSIQVAGQTEVGDTATYEAVVLFPEGTGAFGVVFNEWTDFSEDKQLYLGPTAFQGYAYPRGFPTGLIANPNLTREQWHHVAFVADASEERLYVDGVLVSSRAAGGDIGDGTGLGYVGAIPRDGNCVHGFVGQIDSLRISDVARYSGPSFEAPIGDLTSDENTVLLYNFNEPAGSTTVNDESPLDRAGTLGLGCAGATSPELDGFNPSTTTSSTTTTTSSTTTTTTLVPPGVCGDPVDPPADVASTQGRVVTARDALAVLRTAVQLDACALCVCDVDDSGFVTGTDALIVLKHALASSVNLDCPPCG